MSACFLTYDVGSTYSKASAFCLTEGGLEFLGRAQSPTTLDDILKGLDCGRRGLSECALSDLPTILASSSAAGGLRMVAMGFMPQVTAKAAKEVAMNAGARVLEVVSHDEPPEYRLEILREIRPDIILLAGGTDGGEADSLLENAGLIIKAGIKAKVIIAGNTAAQPRAAAALKQAEVPYARVGNVMPTIHELNVKPARQAIHGEFIKQITRAPGLSKLADLVPGGEVIPTPAAILMGAELLAGGTFNNDGAGGVLVLDIGGATTDIHSVMPEMADLRPEQRGLIINNDKQVAFRTVEGNLGLRVSASGIVEAVGPHSILALKEYLAGGPASKPRRGNAPPQFRGGLDLSAGNELESPLTASFAADELQRVCDYAGYLEENTAHLPNDEWEKELEPALAAAAISTALKRHAGYWVTEANPTLGLAPGSPIGRDLRGIKWVIGVGGFFSHHQPDICLKVLKWVFENPEYSLFPEAPDFRLDNDYLLYAVGLLGRQCPDQALSFAKKYFEME